MFSTASPVAVPAGQRLPVSGQSKPTAAQTATHHVRAMVDFELKQSGDLEGAIRAVARQVRLGFWTVANYRRGRAKTCDGTILDRINRGYLELCARQMQKLQHQLSMSQEAHPDADYSDLLDEVSRLAARLPDAPAGSLSDRARGGLRSRLAARKPGRLASSLITHSDAAGAATSSSDADRPE